jgi:hypothetical protein
MPESNSQRIVSPAWITGSATGCPAGLVLKSVS